MEFWPASRYGPISLSALIWSMEIILPFIITVNVSNTSPRLNVAPFAVHVAGKLNVVVYVPRPEVFCRADLLKQYRKEPENDFAG